MKVRNFVRLEVRRCDRFLLKVFVNNSRGLFSKSPDSLLQTVAAYCLTKQKLSLIQQVIPCGTAKEVSNIPLCMSIKAHQTSCIFLSFFALHYIIYLLFYIKSTVIQ